MRKLLLTAIAALSAFIAFGQDDIKVEAPNVVAADEQFNVTFIIEGEDAPSDFQWAPGDGFQVLWGPQQGRSDPWYTRKSCVQTYRDALSDHNGQRFQCVHPDSGPSVLPLPSHKNM